MHRSLFINAAVVLSFLITATLLAYSYRSLPLVVPLFVSPAGEVLRVAPKSPLTVFRLWLMGVSAQCLCVTLSLAIRRKPDSSASRVLRSAVEVARIVLAAKWVGTVLTFLDLAQGSKRLHGAYVVTSLLAVLLLAAGSFAIVLHAKRAGLSIKRDDLRLSNRFWLVPLAFCVTAYVMLASFPSWLFHR